MTDDLHQLTGAYAADALDDELERRSFENHLGSCEACREEVRTLRETAAALSAAVARTPPAGLRLRVMAEIARTAQQPPSRTDQGPAQLPVAGGPDSDGAGRGAVRHGLRPDESRSVVRRLARRPALAAAVVLLVGGGLAGAGWYQSDQARRTLAQADADRRQTEQLLAIVSDPAARRVSSPVTGGGTATVVRAGTRAAVLTAGLAALPSGRTYQLWLVRPGGVLPAGLGPQGSAGADRWNRVLAGLAEGDSVAISVEPAGGSTQPTTTPIAVIKL